jgi:hypothetical protein
MADWQIVQHVQMFPVVVPLSLSLTHTHTDKKNKQKRTPWPLVRERTIPTERPPLVDEI